MLRRGLVTLVLFLAAGTLGAATHSVDVGPGFAFTPAELTIAPGDTVTWNFLSPNHTTTSDATTGADAWDSGIVASGGSFSHTFTGVGNHPYYCAVHSSAGGTMMNGVITVAAAAEPFVSGFTPRSGSTAGGTAVTITGSNFIAGCAADFGTIPAPTTFIDAFTLVAETPAMDAGFVDVNVSCSTGTATAADTFEFIAPQRGDVNGDLQLAPSDIFYLINHLFASGSAPLGNGDANSNGTVDPSDIFFLINHLFAGGPAPAG